MKTLTALVVATAGLMAVPAAAPAPGACASLAGLRLPETAITSAIEARPTRSYYVGCSKGGQQGLREAQRFPDDYDGLVAGDPANNATRSYLAGHLWAALATGTDPESYIPASTLPLLTNAVTAACDGIDGIKDGVLDDPRACRFDPATLVCATVVSRLGGRVSRDAALEKTQAFFRLFMVPGMNHCSGGPGTDNFDMLTALEQWVEHGVAPARIVASHLTSGKVDRTRPLCPYPQVAVYTGSGSTDEAANFVCRAPRP